MGPVPIAAWVLAIWAVRRPKVRGRAPMQAALGWVLLGWQPRGGRIGGRAARDRAPRALLGGFTLEEALAPTTVLAPAVVAAPARAPGWRPARRTPRRNTAAQRPSARRRYGGGLPGGGGRFGMLSTRPAPHGRPHLPRRRRGQPVDPGGLLADATAEAGRGLAPLTAAAAVGGLGTRLGARGAHWLLIGRRPDRDKLLKWRKPTADGDPHTGGASGGGPGGDGPGGSGSATRTARSSTPTRGRRWTTRTPTAPCCPPAHTTGSSASADTASCTAAAAPPTGRQSACPPPSARRGQAARATPRTPASKCRYGATPSARTFTPGETPDG
jgi:hypothetical protein